MILITGGTGFLGSHVTAYLASQGRNVVVMKRKESSTQELNMIFQYHFGNRASDFLQKISFIDGDIRRAEDVHQAIDSGITQVYHCAATVSFDKKHHKLMYDINVQGTHHLVNALLEKGNIKLCHVSSIAALGRSKNKDLITEQTFWEDTGQNTVYSKTKYQAELEVWRGIAEGLDACIVQPGIIMGVGHKGKGTCKLFGLVEKGLPFYTKGINGYVDVRDVARLMILLMDSDISGERFLLISENLSYGDLLSQIANAMGKKPPYIHAGYGMRKMVVGFDAIKSKMGFGPRTYSKEFARLAGSVSRYDASKIKEYTGYEFFSMSDCISSATEFYKTQNINS
jgi:dihydroflavonol-4-reductase